MKYKMHARTDQNIPVYAVKVVNSALKKYVYSQPSGFDVTKATAPCVVYKMNEYRNEHIWLYEWL